ncbi:hypothetical protein PhCBS80983_g03713 [Powellomyces hirtus]|uniref:Leucine zipper with capping helix domain-containing protein n=1 Tax=Powellomyces hirtus TaxID=109895 RepID=A0A507E2P4_9FUNG|nr:hypothetical protein PhCBS80983_g03713 [Powellomyces hirtus]
MDDRLQSLSIENKQFEERLATLRSGSTGVKMSAEERKKIDAELDRILKEWRRRKRMFGDMWGAVTENIQGNLHELREAIGIETDEAAGVNVNGDLLKGFA